jgi:RimJ/RimL family protein N-acetyltransferase
MIESERLYLVLLSPEFFAASLEGRLTDAESMINAGLPSWWPDEHARAVMDRRRRQIEATPSDAPWLLRAMVRREDRIVVGYINFHGPPDAQGRAELGYTVFEEHRRQGYATEAVLAMMAWATTEHGVRRFLLSISPQNVPSLGLAAKLGFEQVGKQMDLEDGLEYVFELAMPAEDRRP